MSLIKLAMSACGKIDAEYDDKRGLWRRAKGKLLTYPLIPIAWPAPFLGHYLDHRRKEKDFIRHPEKFKKFENV